MKRELTVSWHRLDRAVKENEEIKWWNWYQLYAGSGEHLITASKCKETLHAATSSSVEDSKSIWSFGAV